MPTATPQEWLTTGKACKATGFSSSTLHRWRSEGLFVEGQHYRLGLTARSPIRWNTSAVEEAIQAHRQLPERPADN